MIFNIVMSTMFKFNQIFSIVIVIAITITISCTSNSKLVEAKNGGFVVDLIHRDSPKSPFYNHSLTTSQRVANAIRRSVQWYNYGKYYGGSVDIIPDKGEFLMKLYFGTPPVETLLIIDTGSDLTWIQCEPCVNCYKQTSPIYNSKKSLTYKEIPCTSDQCRESSDTYCKATSDTCQYSVTYHDKSFSHGSLGTEIVILDTTERILRFTDIAFGCGNNNDVGTPFDDKSNGVVGFGLGRESFISQVLSEIDYYTFSYCLVPYRSTKFGKLYIGESEEFPSSDSAISVPLSTPNLESNTYEVSLIGITVGNKRISFPSRQGNMVIDSGTTLTILPSDVYNRVESEVKRYVRLWPVDDPEGVSELCYRSLYDGYFPIITLNFKRGVDLKLKPSNTFIQIKGDVRCFTFASGEKPTVLGNLAQTNFFVTYDLERQLVSFKPTDCENV